MATQQQPAIQQSTAVDQSDSHTLLETTETVSDKMDLLTKQALPGGFDFYKKNWVKRWNNWELMLESRFRSDIIKRISIYEQTFFPKWIQEIKDYTLCTVDRAIRLKEKWLTYLTNEKQPIVRTFVDRLVQTLFWANFGIKVYAVNRKNAKKAKTVQAGIERCFSSSKARRGLVDVGTTAINQWPGYARIWFEPSREKAKEIKDPLVKKMREIGDCYAQFDWVSEFELFGEPFVPFYEQRDIIFRKVMPIASIIKRLAVLNTKLEKAHLQFIIKNPKPFSLKNYEKIRLIKYYENYALNTLNFQVDNLFQLTLDNNHSEYVERWTEDNLVLFLNGYIIYDGMNPLKKITKKVHPFKVANFTRTPGTWIADGAGTLLAWQQKLYDALYNLTFDLIKFSAGPMFLLQPGQSIEGSEKILDYEPFTFKQIRGPGKIEVLELPKPDVTVTKAMADILEMANFALAPSVYNQIQWVSRSATDSNFKYEGLKDAVKALMESLNELLTDAAEDYIRFMKAYMPSEFEVPVFGDDGSVKERAAIKTKDLDGKYIFEFEFESIKDINRIIERWQFPDLVSAVKTLGQDPIDGRRQIKNDQLLKSGLDLFNQNPDIVLNEEEYYQKVLDAKKKWIDLQQAIQSYYNEVVPPQPQQQWPEGTGGQWQFSPEQQAAYAQKWEQMRAENAAGRSNYSQWPEENIAPGVKNPQQKPLDVASILKAAQE